MKKITLKGFTLVEAIVSLAIASILLGSAAPSLIRMVDRSKATSNINRIVTAVNFTRHAAITNRVTATLCASRPDRDCGGKWHEELIVFSDSNKNAKIDGSDSIIARIAPSTSDGTVKWRAFQNRQYLQMTQMGYTNFQNGNFVYCPQDHDLMYARQIVINIQGRARVVHTKNSEGFPIDRKRKLLKC
jgi:type IV fimbrial biogenesis protein FimT